MCSCQRNSMLHSFAIVCAPEWTTIVTHGPRLRLSRVDRLFSLRCCALIVADDFKTINSSWKWIPFHIDCPEMIDIHNESWLKCVHWTPMRATTAKLTNGLPIAGCLTPSNVWNRSARFPVCFVHFWTHNSRLTQTCIEWRLLQLYTNLQSIQINYRFALSPLSLDFIDAINLVSLFRSPITVAILRSINVDLHPLKSGSGIFIRREDRAPSLEPSTMFGAQRNWCGA